MENMWKGLTLFFFSMFLWNNYGLLSRNRKCCEYAHFWSSFLLRFDSDLTQISGPKNGGWSLWSSHPPIFRKIPAKCTWSSLILDIGLSMWQFTRTENRTKLEIQCSMMNPRTANLNLSPLYSGNWKRGLVLLWDLCQCFSYLLFCIHGH